MKKLFLRLFFITFIISFYSNCSYAIIAYEVPNRTVGTQSFSGSLGMDFNILDDIVVTSLGVFDHAQDGLFSPIFVKLYNRNIATTPIAELFFAPGNTGSLIGGSRFLELDTPLELSPGFQGTIVAHGYGISELNGNKHHFGGWTTNNGSGLIDFVGSGRYSYSSGYPSIIDYGGIPNLYAAGTFIYEKAQEVPEPTSIIFFLLSIFSLMFYKKTTRMN